MIEQIDFLVRATAIGAALMLIAQLVAGEVRETIKYPMVAATIGAIGYLIASSRFLAGGGPLDPWINLVAIATPFWIWLTARRLFAREPARRIALLALAVLLIGWVLSHFVPLASVYGFYLLHLTGLALIVDLVRLGLLSRRNGEASVIRLWLPFLAGVLTAVVLLIEMIGAAFSLPPLVDMMIAVLVLLTMLFAGLALMRTAAELLFETDETADTQLASEPPTDDAQNAESA